MRWNRSRSSRVSIVRGLVVAALLLGVSLMLTLLSPEYVSPDLARRLLGALLGAVVIAYANVAPKALSPLLQMRCDPVVEQAVRRFTGWMITLGGVAYAITWMIAPLRQANALSAGFLGAALLLVITRTALGMKGGSRT